MERVHFDEMEIGVIALVEKSKRKTMKWTK